MLDSLQLKKIGGAWLSVMWTASAAAAQQTFVTDLAAIPIAAVAVAVVIALVGGAGATLRKIAEPNVQIHSLKLVVASDMASSMLVGLATFFLCAWREAPPLLAAVCILVAGYGGSRVLDRYLAIGLTQIDRFAGKPESVP